MKILVLTSNKPRHKFLVKKLIDQGHDVLAWAEEKKTSFNENNFNIVDESLLKIHKQLLQQSLKNMANIQSLTNVKIKLFERGSFANSSLVEKIKIHNPDIVMIYGCGIVSKSIIELFPGRIFGSHQGLPQYYRGSGSNFFAFLEKKTSFMGISMHMLDSGIDTGDVVLQKCIAPKPTDTYYSFSAHLVFETIKLYLEVASKIQKNKKINTFKLKSPGKLFQRKDFTSEALEKMIVMQLEKTFYEEYTDSLRNYGFPTLVGG